MLEEEYFKEKSRNCILRIKKRRKGKEREEKR